MEGVDETTCDSLLQERNRGVRRRMKPRKEGKGGSEDDPGEFALYAGRIGGATKSAAGGASDVVIQREGRWASNAFMRFVTANMEDPVLVSEVLVERGGAIDNRVN